jgi:polyisoprenoid-binding protein YceI
MQVGTQRGLASVRYVFDKAVSRFTVQAFASGVLSVFGHNPTIAIRDFEGEVQFVPVTYDKAFVRFSVNTASFEVLDEMTREDRKRLEQVMFQEVLDVTRFPSVVYESRQVGVQKLANDLLQVNVVGDLTLHGITDGLSFNVRVQPFGSMLRIAGEFAIRQSDYGIKPVSIAGGVLRLKDELKFRLDTTARLQE